MCFPDRPSLPADNEFDWAAPTVCAATQSSDAAHQRQIKIMWHIWGIAADLNSHKTSKLKLGSVTEFFITLK